MKFNDLPIQVAVVETSVGDLREYPQVLRGGPAFVKSLGHASLGRLVDLCASLLLLHWDHVSIDTRLSMLMPGMYPCIPGWHCDDFYRPNGGQPDLERAPPAEHLVLILGNCSRTRFVAEPMELPLPDAGEPIYRTMHRRIEMLSPRTFQVESGQVWRFGPRAWHKGEPATEAGWRYFLRLTGSNHWTALNQRRTQTQVYLTEPFVGW